ncbi:TRAP transporter small permease [Oleispirillum naphthae]|uniref:TRAP transporter small permease n=1 Tax=Oleispirillum naphthae TaxID=2838853 RepID=UPI0030825AC0
MPAFKLMARVGVILTGAATLLMLVHVTLDALGRSFLHIPATGAMEIVSYYYMVIIIFVGSFVAAYQKHHIMVDVIYRLLPRKGRAAVYVIGQALTLAYLAAFALALGRQALRRTAEFEEIDALVAYLPIWPARWIAFAAIAAMAALVAVRIAAFLRGGEQEELDVDEIRDLEPEDTISEENGS